MTSKYEHNKPWSNGYFEKSVTSLTATSGFQYEIIVSEGREILCSKSCKE